MREDFLGEGGGSAEEEGAEGWASGDYSVVGWWGGGVREVGGLGREGGVTRRPPPTLAPCPGFVRTCSGEVAVLVRPPFTHSSQSSISDAASSALPRARGTGSWR